MRCVCGDCDSFIHSRRIRCVDMWSSWLIDMCVWWHCDYSYMGEGRGVFICGVRERVSNSEKGALAMCFVFHVWAHPFQIHIEANVWHTSMRYGYDIHWKGRGDPVFWTSYLGASLLHTYWDKYMTHEYAIRVWHTLRRAHWLCVLYFIFGRIPFRQMYDIRVCVTGMTYTEKGAVILCFPSCF